ncbi:cilia- and flagella-associated protein 73-like [Gigantopelta aegis]|uniref:cilia- and flagella-associated protein 73-like n=1 Tax=Gigantopelta aegis TaxID=1735272 RepID=UPI001B888A7D|nr:cilia- and flagella-associated protein 73-like [Gigantopelta aegis]
MATRTYKLDLDNQKRNVFVTQLHEREDEDDITAFPVVKESGAKLVETGINTLQKTLLLKKDVEVQQVHADLEKKRQDFRERMDACAKRQVEIQKKQQRMKDRVEKFEKFIQENEAKRRRAIQKYQQEVKLRMQKDSDLKVLLAQLEELHDRHKYLKNKLAKYKKYEDFLMQVIDAMPEDYLPPSEDKVKGMMMRHRTLNDSNLDLVGHLERIEDQLEELKCELTELNKEHSKLKMFNNSELSRLQDIHEDQVESNEEMEQSFHMSKGELRSRRTEIGIIFMAIDNIYEKCRKELDPPGDKMELEEKLTRIKDHLNDRTDVALMAHPNSSFVPSPSPDSHKSKSPIKKRVFIDAP